MAGLVRWACAVVVAVAVVLLAPVDAAVADARVEPVAPVSCTEDVAACDSDEDGVIDVVEEAICGSATCASGTEDADGDGVADAEELRASLDRGGPGGPVRLRDAGTVRVVLPGPVVIDVPWWPVVAVVAGVGVVVVGVVVRRRRVAARRVEGGQ